MQRGKERIRLKIFQNKYCCQKYILNSAFRGHEELCSFWRVLFAYLIHTVLHIILSPFRTGLFYLKVASCDSI